MGLTTHIMEIAKDCIDHLHLHRVVKHTMPRVETMVALDTQGVNLHQNSIAT